MLLTSTLFDKPPVSTAPLDSFPSSPRLRHPSRLKMTAADYLSDIWQKIKGKNVNLSIILATVNPDSSNKPNQLGQLAQVMRSLVQGIDDFVGFGQDNAVVAILPQTDLGEALQILYQIHDYYGDIVGHLEVISANPEQDSMIQPLLTKIEGASY
ncbi:MAG: hypothetical protein AB4041_06835 [Microcystaceae cyanobacterium]